ncbi:alveolar macrophage chemotactic factor 2-like [Pristis pectinata]|uniref:alveolar macrophage chemotactic factor 2-like n=1 Tax=Pristis pectinata TaxID=685728 RepID=UPI00223E61B0|nr:alveolar macrophage chemotactic factor 2-like [Pristis pectinata]
MNFRFQIPAQIATLFLLQHSFTVEALGVPGSRCLCPVSVKAVRPKIIKNFHIIPKSTDCSKTEVILTVTQGNKEMDVCVCPDKRQGIKLQRCWERIQNDPKKKNKCIWRLSKKGRKGRRRRRKGRRGGNPQSTHQLL